MRAAAAVHEELEEGEVADVEEGEVVDTSARRYGASRPSGAVGVGPGTFAT